MKQRYHILDEIRGITLCSMILYHAVWDLVYMFGRNWAWYRSDFAYIWQQSICWSFILLSGFCFSLGKKKVRRGLVVFGAGALISIVTEIFMPQNRIRFGVLTLLGSSMLIMAIAEKIIGKAKDGTNTKPGGQSLEIGINQGKRHWTELGMVVSIILFAVTKRINYGILGFANITLKKLPDSLYEMGDVGNFIGFTEDTFYSTDYFSLMPWFFLFLTGYYLHKFFVKKGWIGALSDLPSLGKWWRVLGKFSLLIYMLHQPIIYGVLYFIA